jgi:hypothetical protein
MRLAKKTKDKFSGVPTFNWENRNQVRKLEEAIKK